MRLGKQDPLAILDRGDQESSKELQHGKTNWECRSSYLITHCSFLCLLQHKPDEYMATDIRRGQTKARRDLVDLALKQQAVLICSVGSCGSVMVGRE